MLVPSLSLPLVGSLVLWAYGGKDFQCVCVCMCVRMCVCVCVCCCLSQGTRVLTLWEEGALLLLGLDFLVSCSSLSLLPLAWLCAAHGGEEATVPACAFVFPCVDAFLQNESRRRCSSTAVKTSDRGTPRGWEREKKAVKDTRFYTTSTHKLIVFFFLPSISSALPPHLPALLCRRC